MPNLEDIRQRADRGLASVQDIQDLLGYIDTVTQNVREVIVPDPYAVAKALVQLRTEHAQRAAAAQAASDAKLSLKAELNAATDALTQAQFDAHAVDRAQATVDMLSAKLENAQ